MHQKHSQKTNGNDTNDVDWSEVEEELYVDKMPVLAVISDTRLTAPEEWWRDTLGIEHEFSGTTIYAYEPYGWKIEESGDVTLIYNSEIEFEKQIKSEDYERIHIVNPMSDQLSEPVLMERSDLRMTLNHE